ncbi:MAG: hypothetical protein WDZ59_16760 [Pirellulales bacterium]
MHFPTLLTFATLAPLLLSLSTARAEDTPAAEPFEIQLVDSETGRGVPLVELTTVDQRRFYTDSAGRVAFHEPGLMNQRVFFQVRSHGYTFPKDGFGIRGRALDVKPGGTAALQVERLNIAQRLYRVTGAGIYRDSVLLGHPTPLANPLLNAKVTGSDSVMTAVYRGKLYWFWGDTNRPAYPLGNFHVPGATSQLPSRGGLDPAEGVELSYFVGEDGFAKETCRMEGEGPTWITWLAAVTDDEGQEQLLAGYVKIRNPLQVYRRGVARFDDAEQSFRHVADFEDGSRGHTQGHTFRYRSDGKDYIYFGWPFPLVRAPAHAEQLIDPGSYETFTCLQPGSDIRDVQLDRHEDGRLRYDWKRNTPPVGPKEQNDLVERGLAQPDELLLQLRDVETDKPIYGHAGSVYFNEFRNRWVMIVCELGGTSQLGEIWYAEADTPVGPWAYARKVVTHDQYSFYNPKQHPEFDQDGGRLIYFEGTYTHSFSGNPVQTPLYDYNQTMYRLDLTDPRMVLPVPVYRYTREQSPGHYATRAMLPGDAAEREIDFFALDQPGQGAQPVVMTADGPEAGRLRCVDAAQVEASSDDVAFYAMPPGAEAISPALVPLFEYLASDGQPPRYTTDDAWSQPGYERSPKPVCLVWRTGMRPSLLEQLVHFASGPGAAP